MVFLLRLNDSCCHWCRCRCCCWWWFDNDVSRIIDDISQPVPITTDDNDDGDDDDNGMEGEQATVSKQPNKYSFTPLFQNSVLHMMTSLCHHFFILSSNSLRYFFFLPLFIHFYSSENTADVVLRLLLHPFYGMIGRRATLKRLLLHCFLNFMDGPLLPASPISYI